MKVNREHRFLLPRRAVEILDGARTLGDRPGSLVFINGGGEPLEEEGASAVAKAHGASCETRGVRTELHASAPRRQAYRKELPERRGN